MATKKGTTTTTRKRTAKKAPAEDATTQETQAQETQAQETQAQETQAQETQAQENPDADSGQETPVGPEPIEKEDANDPELAPNETPAVTNGTSENGRPEGQSFGEAHEDQQSNTTVANVENGYMGVYSNDGGYKKDE